ncbi:MAG: SDR family oxidoreductase [Acidimicrobiaceae bacterium]|nr:SDR family oxidoreductase [Acidimicrobiaceae bacterium]
MDLGLNGKTALVTGGSSGLGLGTAAALADEGVNVVIASRSREKIDAALLKHPKILSGIECDLSTPDGVDGLVSTAIARLGQVDIVILNAGGPKAGGYEVGTPEAIRGALEQNLVSMATLAQAAVAPMIERDWGRILAITSLWVRQPSPGLILSNTARSGLTAFLKTMATQVARHGVTVNTIQPGFHQTDRLMALNGGDISRVADAVPSKTVGDPYDFGKVAAFMVSEPSRFVNGVSLWVDGGSYTGLQ